MTNHRKSLAGFSLIEVSMTLAVVAFAMIGILGVLPIAFQQSRSVVDETRAAQLARLVFGTIETEPFHAARCFSGNSDDKLNLTELDEMSEPVFLFVFYDVRGVATIVRAPGQLPGAEYRIELRFEHVIDTYGPPPASATPAPSPSSIPPTAPMQRGSMVRLSIVPTGSKKTTIFTGAHFFHRLKQGTTPQ